MYYLYMKQEGEGCDYTIGCGSKLIPLVNYGTENEHQEIKKILEDHISDETHLSECMIVERIQDLMVMVNSIELEILNLRKEKEKQYIFNEIKKLERKLEDI